MKKHRKPIYGRLIALCMAMLLMFTSVPVRAANVEVMISNKAACMRRIGQSGPIDGGVFIGRVVGTGNISVKTGDSSLVVPVKRKERDGSISILGNVKKKNGTTTVTVTVNKKIYRCRVTVCRYENPFVNVKFGNIVVSGKRFDRSYQYNGVSYSRVANKKIRLLARMKPDWKVQGIVIAPKTVGSMEDLLFAASGDVVKINTGRSSTVMITTENTRTGAMQAHYLLLK